MKGTILSRLLKGKTIIAGIVILLSILPLCAAQSSCEQPVTNNYYNSNNTTTNNYYGSSTVTGAPSISPNFINKMLCKYGNSQVCGTGQTLYQDGQTYNIDPAFALAFF